MVHPSDGSQFGTVAQLVREGGETVEPIRMKHGQGWGKTAVSACYGRT